MPRRNIEMYEYRAIIYRLREGMSARQIAKTGLAGRNKVNEIHKLAKQNGWLDLDEPLPDEALIAALLAGEPHKKTFSKSEPHHDFIATAVNEGVNAQVIHQRLVERFGFTGAYNSVQRYTQRLKQLKPPDMTVPLSFEIAQAAQVDFGKGPDLYDERTSEEVKTWFFVMTLCWSRHQYVELVAHQDIETWLRCHQNAFVWFGGVVDKIIIDNPKCAITKACYYDPKVQRSYENFAQSYGFIISACPPYDPQKKGRVEAGVKYVKGNFLPLQQFRSLQHANDKLKQWILNEAGTRKHGSTFLEPLKAFHDCEKAKLKALPIALPEIAIWEPVKLYRDCHVRFKSCLYSAPFDLFHETLWLKATPTTVAIYHQHQCVAQHARLFKKGEKSTKQEHLPPNARFYLKRTPAWCMQQAKTIGENCTLIIDDLINHQTKDLLRQAQGILSLADTYGKSDLEKVCQYAITLDVFDYKTIHFILKQGVENIVLTNTDSDEVERNIYQGGAKYQRQSNEFIH